MSTRLAANYLTLGLKPGDRIASLMPNRCELLIHYIACLKAGLVTVPLNYRYTSRQMDHALEVSDAQIILFHEERREDIEQSNIAGNLPLGIISYGSDVKDYPRLEDLLENGPPELNLPAPEPDWPAVIFFTSGSTAEKTEVIGRLLYPPICCRLLLYILCCSILFDIAKNTQYPCIIIKKGGKSA